VSLARTADDLLALRTAKRRLLVVLAHPDDESYGCAGALARAGADHDAVAVLLCLTRGEASSMGPQRGLSPEEVGDLREERLVQVAARCDLAGLLVPGLPDGGLDRLPVRDLTSDARGVNGHRDHIAAHWATRRALEYLPPRRLALLAYPPEVSEAAKPRLLFPTPETRIDVTLALSEAEIAAKEACLAVHEALVTLQAAGADEVHADDGRVVHPPFEHFDLHGEAHEPRLDDLFAALP